MSWTLILVLSLSGTPKTFDFRGHGSEERCWISALRLADDIRQLPQITLKDALCVTGNL